ncbi:MAG: bifunctional metallophosphatase/5'-nucleotidase [Lachnospiraceae bacterium]|nr:bifunctional metallophosphatase/5'-nucleotidase [Lachnospiraceae bacterium]
MKKTLKIYFTSDMHGYFSPIDYATGEYKDTGLVNCMMGFQKDGNTLILDGGDTIQGSPFSTYVQNEVKDASIFANVMNLAGYDYVTLGNHDLNYGKDYLKSYLNALDATCLCANIKDKDAECNILSSDVRVMENGLKVGLIGVCTDYVRIWEKKENLDAFDVQDVKEALTAEVNKLRAECDLLVGIYHGGFECDLATKEVLTDSRENIAYEICRDLPFDILCTGHQHMSVADENVCGTHLVQTPQHAAAYVKLEAVVEDGKVSVSSELCPAGSTSNEQAKEILAKTEQEVSVWLDTPKGHFDQPMLPDTKVNMALNGSPIADFFNEIQLYFSKADISCTSLANDIKGFGKEVTIRDIVSTYRYENTLVVLEVTGATLRQALERCGEYFAVEDGVVKVSDAFLKPKVEHYNFDFYAGIDYAFDPERPVGKRVTFLRYQGKDVTDDQVFSLCMNNYRASGTGGYDMFKSCKVLREIQTDMVELTINYLTR